MTKLIGRVTGSKLNSWFTGYIILYLANIIISIYGVYNQSRSVMYWIFFPTIVVTVLYNVFFMFMLKKNKFPGELLMLPLFGLLVPAIVLFLYVFVVVLGGQSGLDETKLTMFEVVMYSLIVIYSVERLAKNLKVPIDGIFKK